VCRLQVELAQSEYQLPRLTRMWTHLERQAGGRVRGMGEKQIEVDKRILRTRMGQLKRSLEDVRTHRKQYRERRAAVLSCPGSVSQSYMLLHELVSFSAEIVQNLLVSVCTPLVVLHKRHTVTALHDLAGMLVY